MLLSSSFLSRLASVREFISFFVPSQMMVRCSSENRRGPKRRSRVIRIVHISAMWSAATAMGQVVSIGGSARLLAFIGKA